MDSPSRRQATPRVFSSVDEIIHLVDFEHRQLAVFPRQRFGEGETLVSTRRTASMSAVLQAASMAAKAKLARGFDFDTAASIHAIKSRSKTARSPENGALVQ
jgi:hypothetical protein